MATEATTPQKVTQEWRTFVDELYPNSSSKTYSVPPFPFNRVPYLKETVGGTGVDALVLTKPPLHSNVASSSGEEHHEPGTSGACASSATTKSAKKKKKKNRGKKRKASPPLTAQVSGPSGIDPSITEGLASPQPCSSAMWMPPPGAPEGEVQESDYLDDSAQRHVVANLQALGESLQEQAASESLQEQTSDSMQEQIASESLQEQQTSKSLQEQTASRSMQGQQTSKSLQEQKSSESLQEQTASESRQEQAAIESMQEQQTNENLQEQTTSESMQEQRSESRQEQTASENLQEQTTSESLQEQTTNRQEGMFLLSQLKFGNYLNKRTCAAAFALLKPPMPAELGTDTPYSRGEVDVLIFHRRRGILIVEIKSIGLHVEKNCPLDLNEVVLRRVKKAIKQLDQNARVMEHLVKDIAKGLTIRKTLCLPYITGQKLRQILDSNSSLLKELSQCLSGKEMDASEVVKLCLCADQLSDRATYQEVTQRSLQKLETWWRHRMAAEDPLLCGQGGETLYLDIVARFVGPATTVSIYCCVPPRVEVRTCIEATAELHRRLSMLVLSREQIGILTKAEPLLCITGPPGTGKTILLVLQGLVWLGQGHDVFVFSTHPDTLTVSRLIQFQLEETMSNRDVTASSTVKPGKVQWRQYDIDTKRDDVDKAIDDLTKAAGKNGTLRVIMDEVDFGLSMNFPDTGERTACLMDGLVDKCKTLNIDLCLWCARMWRTGLPKSLQEAEVTTALRSAPSVRREVQCSFHKYDVDIEDYNAHNFPAPGEGPEVIRLHHTGEGHDGKWPVTCFRCGTQLAEKLKDLLQVGKTGQVPLSWRHVFVVTRSSELCDDIKDEQGNVTSEACGLVQGLRSADIPLCVLPFVQALDVDKPHLRPAWEKLAQEVATGHRDEVTVAEVDSVLGLERPIVAWLAGRHKDVDADYDDDYLKNNDRLYIFSRCTTQLITVDVHRSV